MTIIQVYFNINNVDSKGISTNNERLVEIIITHIYITFFLNESKKKNNCSSWEETIMKSYGSVPSNLDCLLNSSTQTFTQFPITKNFLYKKIYLS